MKADALISDLTARGVTLSAFGNDLDFDAPAGVMTPETRAALSASKHELLASLRRPGRWACWMAPLLRLTVTDPVRRSQLLEEFEERAGVLEYEANLARELAEAGASHEILLKAGGRHVGTMPKTRAMACPGAGSNNSVRRR